MSTKAASIAANAFIVAVTVAAGLFGGEFFFRKVDGYRLDVLPLVIVQHDGALETPDSTYAFAHDIRLNPEFDVVWYNATPKSDTNRQPRMPIPSDWTAAFDAYPPGSLHDEFQFLYNVDFLNWACETNKRTVYLREYKKRPGFVYAYKQPGGSRHPEYRQIPGGGEGSNTFNNFGFRGPDLSLEKDARTIRLAFLGASTTQNGWPYTYPEFVVTFLREWAKAKRLDIKFDVINAGRGGETTESIAEIFRREVAPLRPDIVVYYEGANDLQPNWIVDKPQDADARQFSGKDALPLERYSALINRVYELLFRRGGPGAEPYKPPHTLKFDIYQKDPDIEREDLPFRLHTQVESIRQINADAKRFGGEVFVGTFVVIAKEGMRLDPEKHRVIWRHLNQYYLPLTYAEIQQAVELENTVFRKLVAKDGMHLIKVAEYFPQEPDFFADSVHFADQGGFRLQAWIVAQQLARYVEDQLKAGAWPKTSPPNADEIAWLRQPPIKFDLSCVP